MYMLGTVITHLVQKAGLLISAVKAYLITKLLQLRGVLIVLKTQSVELSNQFNQLVPLVQKIKALAAQCITQAQSIKVVLINVLAKVGAIGLQLLTTARQTPQRVIRLLKKDK